MKASNTLPKLFTAPRNLGKESERAAIRAKHFNEQYEDLAKDWNDKLINAGLDAAIVYDKDNARMSSDAFTVEGEEQFNMYARWYWVAKDESFAMRSSPNRAETKRIWKLFAIHGKTEREIAEALDLPRTTVQERLRVLEERCKEDVKAGKLLSTKDTKADDQDWERLQAIKVKHIALVRSSNFGEQLVDSVTDALVPRSIDQDAVDALIAVATSLSLSLGGAK